jgi:pimeloyl-ACP methyl ester carboxylesterase
LPPIQVPTLGVWGSEDFALTERAMTGTERYVAAPWRYERMEGLGHWMPLEAPERVNALLLSFLDSTRAAAAASEDSPAA